MPDWLDTPGEILAVLTILSILLGGLIWLIRNTQTLKPNHGSSMRDAVDRIESTQLEHRKEQREDMLRLEGQIAAMRIDVSDVHDRISKHVQWHLDHAEGKTHSRSTD